MATLDELEKLLRERATAMAPSTTQLDDSQYEAGFKILSQGSGRMTYEDFIVPQLSRLLEPLCESHGRISVLEVGPGPESVLGWLSEELRQKIKRYVAFEPNEQFAARLGEGFCSEGGESSLPSLESAAIARRMPFTLESGGATGYDEKFDVVLFCHSMYGMKPKRAFLERALKLLVGGQDGGIVVVFHREGNLSLDGLVCYRTASFPTGIIRVEDDDERLDCLAQFIVGFSLKDTDAKEAVQLEWRKVCRTVGRREQDHPGHLSFNAPTIMVALTRHATTLPELMAQVSLVSGDNMIKNRHARLHQPACIIRPQTVQDIQKCVRWALDRAFNMTIVGGGHSGHCLQPNVVAIDMGTFDQVDIFAEAHDTLAVVGAGCKTGDVIRKTMAAGFTIPLGSRPSVGAGLWLQGGIGHLSRRHGLACDAVVGAVLVSVASGQVFYVGRVPSPYRPPDAVRPANDSELLWGLKGAGTNFGIVVSVIFDVFKARTYSIYNWIVPLDDPREVRHKLGRFDYLAKFTPDVSTDGYLYWDTGKLHLGITMCAHSNVPIDGLTQAMHENFGPAQSSQTVDGVGLFETEMYMSGMHGGHGGGKTSAFKRCVFLKATGGIDIADALLAALETRPSPRCYLHLLHGSGGGVGGVASEATAFGCRDWEFACVVTGVWDRQHDGSAIARAAERWVYDVVERCLTSTSCTGVYGADLGPDPRDAHLALRAFGPNLPRLARLKQIYDPYNVLAYACPLPTAACPLSTTSPLPTPSPLPTAAPPTRLTVLVTGHSGAGKDYCALRWASALRDQHNITAQVARISDGTKHEYAAATGASLPRLLEDRAYKEQHRPAMTAFYADQVRRHPHLPQHLFRYMHTDVGDVDVFFVTGMRDEAPVASYAHVDSDRRFLEVKVTASKETRMARRGYPGGDDNCCKDLLDCSDRDNCPSLVFENENTTDADSVETFAGTYILPFVQPEGSLQQLKDLVRSVPNFPHWGFDFRDVLGLSQHKTSLDLCTSLFETHFAGDWSTVDAIASCETSGFVFATALALRVGASLALIREAGKVPPPRISVSKSLSHISALGVRHTTGEKAIAIGRGVIRTGASVVVVDDVLATGKTLCAVLQLLAEARISADKITVMVVAEFPYHRGRQLLRQHGFGAIPVQSLLVFGGA